MGSRLLNGCPQLSVSVTLFPLILIVLSSTVTPGTIAGTPIINKCMLHILSLLHSYLLKSLWILHFDCVL